MVKLFQSLIKFIYPPTCPVCSDFVDVHGNLCAKCWARFNWISNPKCFKCGYPFPADLDLGPAPLCPHCASGECDLDFIRSACVYDDVSKNIMLPFKHASALKYQTLMSNSMINCLRDLNLDVDVVMPVPLAYKRLFKRGYNQATLLARPIVLMLFWMWTVWHENTEMIWDIKTQNKDVKMFAVFSMLKN